MGNVLNNLEDAKAAIGVPADYPWRNEPWCAVLATAIFTGRSFAETWDFAKKKFKKPQNWRGMLLTSEVKRLVSSLNKDRSAQFTPSRRMTLNTFAKTEAKEGYRYYVLTTRHAQVVEDGYVTDQEGTVPVTVHPKRNKRVKFAIAKKVN